MKHLQERITVAVAMAVLGAAVAHSQEVQEPIRCLVVAPSPTAVAGTDEAASATCNGTCVIDVAFSYLPEALTGDVQTPGELQRDLVETLVLVTGIYQASGVDVEFRFAGLAPDGRGRPPHADLWYLIERSRAYWTAVVPNRASDGAPSWRWNRLGYDGWMGQPAGQERTLAHEFGHNLGLNHGSAGLNPGLSDWAGGNGYYLGEPFRNAYGSWTCTFSMMVSGYSESDARRRGCRRTFWPYRFSSRDDTHFGRAIGDAEANAVSVLRRNVPYLAARAASRGAGDYGCTAEQISYCLVDGRFRVYVFHEGKGARRLPIAGDNAVLFYFFEPSNPEMLLKVLNGCAVNGHWWVFGSAATDLPYRIEITDLAARNSVRYDHQEGNIVVGTNGFSGLGVINDVRAFVCE